VIFSGIQPTGVPHLGNYLGALHEWVKLQDNAKPGTRLFFSIVDLHALTIPQDAAQLRQWRREAFATLLAVGLDPKKSAIFHQSAVCRINCTSTVVCSNQYVQVNECYLGAGTYRAYVDSQHGGLNGISFTDDPVEGKFDPSWPISLIWINN